MRTTRDTRTRSWFSAPLVIESIDDPPSNARLSSRAFVNAMLGSNTNASCPAALRSPNVTALKLSVMPSMLATDTDCGSFTGYDAFVTISESGGTTGSSERTAAVTPYAQIPLTATGIPQLNEDGMPTILITLASRCSARDRIGG